MPIEQRSASTQIRAVAIGVIGLAVAALLVVGIVRVATGRDDPARSGDGGGRFTVGNAAQLAQNIAKGGPFLLPDVSGNGQNRPIFMSHIGDDPETGWYAFEARQPDGPADCFVQWDRDARELRDECDETVFAPDGDGLRQYPVEVTDSGEVVVDLRQDRDADASS